MAQLLAQGDRRGGVSSPANITRVVLSTRLTKTWSCEAPVPVVVDRKCASSVIFPPPIETRCNRKRLDAWSTGSVNSGDLF